MMRIYSMLFCMVFFISCKAQNQKAKLEPAVFLSKSESLTNSVILDVRTPDEYASGFIKGAVNVDYRDKYFQTRILDMNKDKSYFVYCLSGGRSSSAADFMRKSGFENVYELDGGMIAWNNKNLPVESASGGSNEDKISSAAFESMIKSDKPVLIDFYAPWCGPCRKMFPILEELTKEYDGKATIIRINIDENKKLTREMNIDEIPYFKLYKNGQVAGNYIGQLDKASFIRILDGK